MLYSSYFLLFHLFSLVIRNIPQTITIEERNSFQIFVCNSFNSSSANITPKMEDVENIITDLMVPICFIPFKKRKSEPAKPPKLKIIRFGICSILITKDIEKDKLRHIASVIEPPIKDFS